MPPEALKHEPLAASALSAASQKALGGPMKLAAARGLVPLSDPHDLLSVLYQLSVDEDEAIRAAATKTARDLPDAILAGALADVRLDGRVLDFFAKVVSERDPLIEVIILNQSAADETIAELAAAKASAQIDLIAQNEERLLRYPRIIAAMYHNRKARMSTVDRAVELAVRHGVRVPDLPAWDELLAALSGGGEPGKQRGDGDAAASGARQGGPAELAEADALFAQLAGQADNAPVGAPLAIAQMTIPMKIRLATLGNKAQRAQLIRDTAKLVALAAIKSPGVSELEAAKYAGNHSLAEEVIAFIAHRRDWTKLYGTKLALVQNPKTPIPAAIRFLDGLREKDLRAVARSKGISSAVTAQARKRLVSKSKGARR